MKYFGSILALVLAFSLISPVYGEDEVDQVASTQPKKPVVVRFQIYDPIEDPAQSQRFVERMRGLAKKDNCLVVLAIDSPGGDPVLVSHMLTALLAHPGKRIAYVDKARYGGAFGPVCGLALACDTVLIHPEARMGTKCQSTPLPLDQCKRCPASEIAPQMMECWLKGTAMPQLTLTRFAGLKRCKGVTDPGGLFAVAVIPAGGEGGRDVEPPAGKEVKTVCFTADEAVAKGLADKVTTNIEAAITDQIGDKEYLNVCLPLSSKLGRNFLLAKGAMDDLAGVRRDESGDAGKVLSYYRKLRNSAGAIRGVLKNCPIIETMMEKELRACLVGAPLSEVVREKKPGWAVKALDGMCESYDKNIDDQREYMEREAKRKSVEKKARAEARERARKYRAERQKNSSSGNAGNTGGARRSKSR